MGEHLKDYEEGAANRLNGVKKADSAAHLTKASEWQQVNANRRGWDDMHTFLVMNRLVAAHVRAKGGSREETGA